jgi:hypothetical protein
VANTARLEARRRKGNAMPTVEQHSWLQSAFGVVGDLAQSAEDAADSAVQSVETTASSAVQSAENSSAVQSVENAASSAESAASSAVQSVESAASSAQSTASSAVQSVESAASSAESAASSAVQSVENAASSAQSTASSAVQSVESAASSAVQTVESVATTAVEDVKAVGTAAMQGMTNLVGDPSNLTAQMPPFQSGASLPQPSYVAGTAKDSLQGGPTASAGDSTFVTGAQKGTLLQKAGAIKSAAKGLLDAEAAIESQGKGDKSAIDTAKNLKSVADSMLHVANALDSVQGSENADALGAAGKASELGDSLINAADAIIKINDASGQLKAFQDNPSKETAEAWARSVGGLFDSLANFVPDVEPKFISDYWKGLLSAPKNYIEAFITMQNVYYGNIDKEAGLSKSTGLGGVAFIGHAATKRVSDGSWEGDLTDIYYPGYFLPKLADGTTFTGFMIAHRKTEGMDLWDTDIKVGKAALLTAISRDVPDDDPAKSAWMAHVGKF